MAQRLAGACSGYRILCARGESGKRARRAREIAQRMRTIGVLSQMSALSSTMRGARRAGWRLAGAVYRLGRLEVRDTNVIHKEPGSMDSLTAARTSMGVSLAFHIIFAALGVGLPVLLLVAEGLGLR